MDYFNLIPSDITNIIISYISSSEDLKALFDTFSLNNLNNFEPKGSKSERQIAVPVLNWSTIYQYHFGKYKQMTMIEYMTTFSAETLINNFKLEYTVNELLNLKKLSLPSRELTEIPPEIFDLTNLQDLSLNNNQITQVPKEIRRLTNLQELFLSNNKFIRVPPEISGMNSLQKLYLSSNRMVDAPQDESINESIRLDNLRVLHFDSNYITKIPQEIFNLNNLQVLNLINNNIMRVP